MCKVTFDALLSVLLSMHFSAVVADLIHFPQNSELLPSAERKNEWGVCT